MKKIFIAVMIIGMFALMGCTKYECPLNMINPQSCEFGTYTTTEAGCTVTKCRPSAEFDCGNLKTGDSYYDGCNTCGCTPEGTACTAMACLPKNDSRIKGEGEMCGGIAGFMCEPGLTCKYEGDYPDAAGTCVKSGPSTDCPQLMPPSPDFCKNGTITATMDAQGVCVTGYECA